MAKVLMLLDNPLTNDRRVSREATCLAEMGFNVTLLCTKSKEAPNDEMQHGVHVKRIFDLSIFDPKKIGNHKKLAQSIVANYEFDIIHAHDQTMLSIAVEIKKLRPVKLVYDSHELFHSWPLNLSNFKSKLVYFKSLVVRRILIRREKRNGKRVDFLITVNNSLAHNLREYFKLKESNILVLRNTPEESIKISHSNILREKFGLPETQKILVFIGANVYLNSLNMEQVFEEFATEKAIAVVVIATFNENSKLVKEFVSTKGYTNVFFHDKVKPSEINKYLSSADVGLVPTWNKKDLSYWFALDNKLFEYIQSGIPVLATAQPEYKLIVEQHECGVCVNPETENAYLNGFKKVMMRYDDYKANTLEASKILTWENEKQKLVSFYQETVIKNKI